MSTDWMPGSRIGQLAMAKKWVAYITTALATQWGIPKSMMDDLEQYTNSANDALETAMTVNRTEAINANVRVTFGALVSHMRDIKRRYLFMPPLTEVAWVSLELRLPDTTPTRIGPPTSVVTMEISYPHKNSLDLRITPMDGQSYEDRADWGFRVHYGVLPQQAVSEEMMMDRMYLRREPQRPEELTQSFFTRRKRSHIEFDYDNSGMKCFVCIRYENGKGDHGPWGPMVSAFIP